MNQLQSVLNSAVLRILKPLVRVLLRHGISHAEFSELAKLAYVEVAEKDFPIEGRKQSVARICVLTGMHRKDVNAIRERLQQDNYEVEQLSRAARVISGWLRDADFHDKKGKPKPLLLEDKLGFSELVKRYSGDMPVRAILDELVSSGSVAVEDRERVRLVNPAYIPYQSDDAMLRILGISTADLLRTMEFNLTKPEAEQDRLQLVVDYTGVSESKAERFKQYSEREVYKVLQKFDKWLADNDKPGDAQEETKRVGFGLYYFEGDIDPLHGDGND